MHVHLPKPMHGWRAFFGEVGIIVLGVLIALGAGQAVETLHGRSEMSSFRAAVRQETAVDLATYEYRMKLNHCVDARLDELQAWLDGWRSGHPRPLANSIGAPTSLSLETSVWTIRDPNVVSHMPLQERMGLSRLYDAFANNDSHRLDERQAWLDLAQFDGATNLDHADMIRLQGLISRARYQSQHITGNALALFKQAKAMGITPQWHDYSPPSMGHAICNPLFAPTGQARR